MKYATFDESGRIKDAHNDHTKGEAPELAVEISDAQWDDRFNLRLVGDEIVVDPLPPPAARVPDVVSMRQVRLALRRAGKLTQAESAIKSIPGEEGDYADIEWNFATSVRRSHPLVAFVRDKIGMSAADLDALFITAATL